MLFLRKVFTATGLAFDSIRAHKLRSFLPLLGVIVGVASVILVGAAIDGLGVYAEQITSKAFGTDSFLVAQIASIGRLSGRELADKQKHNKRIRMDDLKYLRSVAGDEVLYSPYQQRVEDVKAENQVYEAANVIGSLRTCRRSATFLSRAGASSARPRSRGIVRWRLSAMTSVTHFSESGSARFNGENFRRGLHGSRRA